MKNPYLHRYWIEFDLTEIPRRQPMNILYRGCGVTAYHVGDALMILQSQLLLKDPLPPIVSLQEDFDVSTLDRKHLLSNIGVTIFRGTWYPNIGTYHQRVIP